MGSSPTGATSFRIRTTPPDYHVFLAALTNGILIGEIIAYAAPTKDEAIAEGLRRLDTGACACPDGNQHGSRPASTIGGSIMPAMATPAGTANFSVDETRKLRELATAGISMAEAGRRLHRSHSTVIRHARKLGLEWRRPPTAPKRAKAPKAAAGRRWTEAEDARLRQLVATGASIDQAAKDLDRQVSLVWRRADRMGLTWARSRFR